MAETTSSPYDALQVGDEVLVHVPWASEVGHRQVGRKREPVTIPPGDAWCRITKVRERNAGAIVHYEVTAVDPKGANVSMIPHTAIKEAR